MKLRAINSAEVYETKSKGFSQGIFLPGMQLGFLSGQVAWDCNRSLPTGMDLSLEAELAMKNIHTLLKSEGRSFDDIVMLRVYLVDLTREKVMQVSGKINTFFPGNHKPASTMVGISSLAHKDLNLEIEAIFA
ncbi:MAG: RidA family protein [Spirochaetia bacterium]|nr:RidA family protein [Spirochaetia bacterium]